MDYKPELICFNTYMMSGAASFWLNILSNDEEHFFEKKVVHIKAIPSDQTYLLNPFGVCLETVFVVDKKDNETTIQIAKRLNLEVSNSNGVILANFTTELFTLHLHPKSNKTVYYICHDEIYVPDAIKYEFLIDVFVVHNPVFFDVLSQKMPKRLKDVHYLPYGVNVPQNFEKKINLYKPLNLVWLARITNQKGIYDIPKIDDSLRELNIEVNWTIIGNGPEKNNIVSLLNNRSNFTFLHPQDYKGVAEVLKLQDVFILPSRLDGLPVALLEAMSFGCVPIISKFNEGIQKIITPEQGFVCEVGNNEQFVENIILLHKDRALLGAISSRNIDFIDKNYNIKIQAKKYFELFKKFELYKKKPRTKYIRYTSIHSIIPKFLSNFLIRLKSLKL